MKAEETINNTAEKFYDDTVAISQDQTQPWHCYDQAWCHYRCG